MSALPLVRGLHNLPEALRGAVVAIGNFDGVHRGHQALIERARTLATGAATRAVVMSFEPTPRELFQPAAAPPRVLPLADKRAALQAAGADAWLILRFSRALAALEPEAFIRQLLLERLAVRAVVVGEDFRFGQARRGDVQLLTRELRPQGRAVEAIGTITLDGLRCSSTLLRERLGAGDLSGVRQLLGRPYALSGVVRHGLKLGRDLGMPTANLAFRRPLALAHGVYAVRVREGRRRWQGVASFGVRPTLGLSQCLLEVHVFDDRPDLYGRRLSVEVVEFLRPQARFDSLAALAAQMQADAEAARTRLSRDPS